MLEVLSNLLAAHNPWLVMVAGVVAIVSTFSMVVAARRAMEVPKGKSGWVAASALVSASGAWVVGVVLLLAFQPTVDVSIDFAAAFLSLGMLGFVAFSGTNYLVRNERRPAIFLAGSLIALGLFIAKVLLLTSLRGPEGAEWDGDRLSLALAFGAPFIVLAIYVMATIKREWGGVLAAVSHVTGNMVFHVIALTSFMLPETYEMTAKASGSSPLIAVSLILGLVPLLALTLGAVYFDRYIGQRRKAEEERTKALVNATTEGLVLLQQGQILELNDRFVDLVGLKRSDLISAPLCKIAQDTESVAAIRTIEVGETRTCRIRSMTGPFITAQITASEVDYLGEPARLLAFRDISSEERARSRIMHMAHHDALTGLPNRLCFREKLDEALAEAWREHTLVALMFFDLDRFKEVNDVHGHATGDDLLVAVAERMLDALPKHAIAARLSGDEFAVILPDIDSRLDAVTVAERVVDNVGSPLTLGTVHLNVSASGGVTVFPLDGEDKDRLMNQADLALYKAKNQGRNCVCDFDPEMGRLMQERRELEDDLAMAIEDDLLDLHFQPQAMLGTGEIVGFEALVRWNDEKRGFVSPAEFVQLAEETGQILTLGRWVIEKACREAVSWPENTRISVNVSPAQFRQGNIILTIERALKSTGLDPRRLEIEITEGVLIDDESRALTLLRRLKDIGVGLAIDDFGTGYASLNYLRAFPFDKIKIDRAFMSGLQNQPEAQIIVHSTIDLAHQLGMGVVVEGIEELDELRALGEQPDVVLQGYLLSRPITRGQIPGFLSDTPEFFDQLRELCPNLRKAG